MIAFRARVVLLALSLMAIGPMGVRAQALVGDYCLVGVREVGACFRFSADGTFQYFLAYGAYDETSEGTWRRDGDGLILHSPPFDRLPAYAFARHERGGDGTGTIVYVTDKSGNKLHGFEVSATCKAQPLVAQMNSARGYELACGEGLDNLQVALPVLGVAAKPVPLPAEARAPNGSVFVTFDPGDLGRRRFADVRMTFAGDALVLRFQQAPFPELEGARLEFRRSR